MVKIIGKFDESRHKVQASGPWLSDLTNLPRQPHTPHFTWVTVFHFFRLLPVTYFQWSKPMKKITHFTISITYFGEKVSHIDDYKESQWQHLWSLLINEKNNIKTKIAEPNLNLYIKAIMRENNMIPCHRRCSSRRMQWYLWWWNAGSRCTTASPRAGT